MKNVKNYNDFVNQNINENIIDNILYKNIPDKYRKIYKGLKKIFNGPYTIQFIPNYKEWPMSKPKDIIEIRGKSDDVPFYCKRNGFKTIRYSGSALLTFYLKKNYNDILNWINGNIKDVEQLDDFLYNFDEYQGLGNIQPTKERPYEYIDLD